jgi:hypothetical protein
MARAPHQLASLSAWFLLAVATAAAGCGGSTPAGPTSQPLGTPPPAPFNNPPAITSLTLSSPRVEAGENVQVTAVVEDAETPVDQLTYDWSATPVSGVFSGSGRQVRWTAPASLQTTPDLYTLRLVVTEKYTEHGQARKNTVSSSVPVHYNDSRRDIRRISLRFLTELFPDYSVPAAAAVQDFSDNLQLCPKGKADEFNDVANNRANFHILSGTYTDVSISLDETKTFADVAGTCVFRDIPMNPADRNFGKRESVPGICTLTAVYENWRWFLCESHFRGTAPGVTLESLRYRVPGRIIEP